MVFQLSRKRLIVDSDFPPLTVGGVQLNYISEFKYLGHMITDKLSDDLDIKREMCFLFVGTDTLLCRYHFVVFLVCGILI